MTRVNGPTPGGIRVSYVSTPPDNPGGYARKRLDEPIAQAPR